MAKQTIKFTQESLLFFLNESRKKSNVDPDAIIFITENEGVLSGLYFDPDSDLSEAENNDAPAPGVTEIHFLQPSIM